MAFRHSCRNRPSALCPANVQGKPRNKVCPVCRSSFAVFSGRYGVFTHTGTGHYPLSAAHYVCQSEARADAWREANDPESGGYAKNYVVRFVS